MNACSSYTVLRLLLFCATITWSPRIITITRAQLLLLRKKKEIYTYVPRAWYTGRVMVFFFPFLSTNNRDDEQKLWPVLCSKRIFLLDFSRSDISWPETPHTHKRAIASPNSTTAADPKEQYLLCASVLCVYCINVCIHVYIKHKYKTVSSLRPQPHCYPYTTPIFSRRSTKNKTIVCVL